MKTVWFLRHTCLVFMSLYENYLVFLPMKSTLLSSQSHERKKAKGTTVERLFTEVSRGCSQRHNGRASVMGLAAAPGPREMEWLLLAWSSSQRLNPASGFTESEVLKAKHLNSLSLIHQGDYSVHPEARDCCCSGTH